MRIDIRERQTGKTYDLMWEIQNDPKAIVVVHSYREAERLKKDYPLLKEQIIPIESVISGRIRGKQISCIHVDNLDLILPYLLGGRIGTVTLTPQE